MRQMTVCVVVVLGVLAAAEARAQDDRPATARGERVRLARLPVRAAARVGRRPRQLDVRAGRQRLVHLRRRPVDAGPEGLQCAWLCDRRGHLRSAAGPTPSSASTSTRRRPTSEYRDFVDNNRLPITQTTRLQHGRADRQREVRAGRARPRGGPAGLGAEEHRARTWAPAAGRSTTIWSSSATSSTSRTTRCSRARSRRRDGRRWRRRSRAWTSGC